MASSIQAPFADPIWHSRYHSPYYDDSHRRLQQEVRDYVDREIIPFCEQWEREGRVPPEVIQRHSDLGYMAVAIHPLEVETLQKMNLRLPGGITPENWDGFHDLIVIDEIARCGYLGVIWALTCGNSIGAPPLINFGTRQQKEKFLPDIYAGKLRFCLAVTEPEAGSDVAGLVTTAERRGDKYIVNGAKKWITNGYFADYCTAAVRTGGPGKKGISALIIPLKGHTGVTCRKIENSGVASSGSTYIEFDDVEVPVTNLLGQENAGFQIIMSNFNHERLWLACTSLRLARVCALDAYTYAKTRETFGKTLLSNQIISAKISSFGRVIDPVHSFMEQLVFLIEQERASKDRSNSSLSKQTLRPLQIGGLIANLKVSAGRALEYVNREAQQILGGAGYSRTGRGARIEQISRDVRVMVVGGGSEEILSDLALKEEIKLLTRSNKL